MHLDLEMVVLIFGRSPGGSVGGSGVVGVGSVSVSVGGGVGGSVGGGRQ